MKPTGINGLKRWTNKLENEWPRPSGNWKRENGKELESECREFQMANFNWGQCHGEWPQSEANRITH